MRGGDLSDAELAQIKGLTDGSYICGSAPADDASLRKHKIIDQATAAGDAMAKAVYRASGNIYLVKKDKAPDGRSLYVTPTP